MAEPHSVTVAAQPGHMDPAVNQRNWQAFLRLAKWFSLGILGLTFFLIIWLIGHAPLVPTFLIVALVAFGIGALFH